MIDKVLTLEREGACDGIPRVWIYRVLYFDGLTCKPRIQVLLDQTSEMLLGVFH